MYCLRGRTGNSLQLKRKCETVEFDTVCGKKVSSCHGCECLWIPLRHSTRNLGFIGNLCILNHEHPSPRFLFVVSTFLSGRDTTSQCTCSAAMWGGTIMLDLQSSSCVQCQLFPNTQLQPRGPAVLRRSPQPAARDTVAEASRGTAFTR